MLPIEATSVLCLTVNEVLHPGVLTARGVVTSMRGLDVREHHA